MQQNIWTFLKWNFKIRPTRHFQSFRSKGGRAIGRSPKNFADPINERICPSFNCCSIFRRGGITKGRADLVHLYLKPPFRHSECWTDWNDLPGLSVGVSKPSQRKWHLLHHDPGLGGLSNANCSDGESRVPCCYGRLKMYLLTSCHCCTSILRNQVESHGTDWCALASLYFVFVKKDYGGE